MYNLHHTEGIILRAADFGEADRIYNIYTKDFGKISALAKGVRLEKSKLRCHLSPFSFLKISFIEGREFFRLTDAVEIDKPNLNGKKFFLLGRMSLFIERMIKGQEKDEGVWNLIISAFSYLFEAKQTPDFFEPLFCARLLHRLGYVSSKDENITNNDWCGVLCQSADLSGLEDIAEAGLSASHL